MVGDVPLVLVTNPKLKLDSLDALIAQCKARPGEVAFALNALGSQAHLLTELFQLRTGAAINMIPYKGSGPAVVDLLGGVVAADIENMPAVLEHIPLRQPARAGHPVVGSLDAFPAVPTMAELGYPEFVASPWFAVMAPKGTDPKIIVLLNRHINEALQSQGGRRGLCRPRRHAGHRHAGSDPRLHRRRDPALGRRRARNRRQTEVAAQPSNAPSPSGWHHPAYVLATANAYAR